MKATIQALFPRILDNEMDNKTSDAQRGRVWPTESLEAHTIFSVPPQKPAGFRSLTLVNGAPERFAESEARGTLNIRLARLFEDRHADPLRPRRGVLAPAMPSVQKDLSLYSLLAHEDGRFVGSLSVRVDSVRGLAVDELYGDETAALREAGVRLCEFVDLAVDMYSAPRRAAACAFHAAYLLAGKVWACEYGLIEAPVQHAEFLCKALGFEPIGEQRANRRASSQETLLCVHLRSVLERLAAIGGKPEIAVHDGNLLPFGFSPQEAAGVTRRLLAMVAGAGSSR
jgi:hypothetical protein